MSAFPKWIGADGLTHQYYMRTKPVTFFEGGSDMAYGVTAIKRELLYNGFGKGTVNPYNFVFGAEAEAAAKEFQAARGLESDGVVGPKTCKALFKKRVAEVESSKRIPDNLLGKLTGLESLFDPAARGSVDNRDRGLDQINAGAHPEVSNSQAFDPEFALNWTGDSLRDSYDSTQDWDGALAAHNVGLFYAKKWVNAGKPAFGILNAGGKDIAEICTNYVRLVRSQV